MPFLRAYCVLKKGVFPTREGLLGRKIISPGSILFLDEIQATPNALQALRYFYEELPEIGTIL